MQIRIEIDVKPEELRRFLGLPDVAGLQEDLIEFLRDKLGAAADGFDPASFVRDNLQTLKSSAPWQRLLAATKASVKVTEPVVKGGVQRARRVARGAVGVVTDTARGTARPARPEAGSKPKPKRPPSPAGATAARKPRPSRQRPDPATTTATDASAAAPRRRRSRKSPPTT